MNSKEDDKLAEVFDTFPVVEAEVVPENKQQKYQIVDVNDEAETDMQHVRTNLYSLIDKGTEAVDNALKVANEMQHPRAYEVAGNLMKNVGDLTDKLIQLQKTRVDMDYKEKKTSQNVNVDKAVFVGSTAELLKAIKHHADSDE